MGKDNGGHVFPMGFHPEGNSADQCGGLTIRDYFAAKAMQAIITSPILKNCQKDGHTDADMIAYQAYVQADAMLAERKKEDSK